MTVRPSQLAVVAYEAESSFGEDASTLSSPIRLPILGPPTNMDGLSRPNEELPYTRAIVGEGWFPVPGAHGGSFRIRMPLTGYGATAAGSLSARVVPTLLGLLINNAVDANSVGTTCDGTGTASAFGVNAGTFADGALARVGALGDGRGGGRMIRVNDLTAGTLTSRNALAAAPNSGDVVYAVEMVYPKALAAACEVAGIRTLIQTGNMQVLCGGCYLMGFTISGVNNGQILEIELEIGVSWVKHVALTFPITATLEKFAPVRCSNGFLHINNVGTATAATYKYRNLRLSFAVNTQVDTGPETAVDAQITQSVKMLGVDCMISFDLDPEAATATPTWYDDFVQDPNSQVAKEVYLTWALNDGRSVCLALSSMVFVEEAPYQSSGPNRITVRGKAQANHDVSNLTDLWLTPWILGIS